ncbi:MAG TPA: TlpA disulfide reductase family protein [Actinomycetota bacterium]|nr:TlpA disulfide reductase family protein [Actinomycetota bacterium]
MAKAKPNRAARQARRTAAKQVRAKAKTARQRRHRLTRLAWAASSLLVVALAATWVTAEVRHAGARAGTVRFDRSTGQLAFDLPAFAGGRITSASLAGTPLVLNFYASWCQVCNAEMPQFERVHQELAGKVNFLGVNPQSNDTDTAQAAMVRRTGVTYPTARDAGDVLLNQFNTTGALPTTLLITTSGRVVDVHNGGLDQAGLQGLIARDLGVALP